MSICISKKTDIFSFCSFSQTAPSQSMSTKMRFGVGTTSVHVLKLSETFLAAMIFLKILQQNSAWLFAYETNLF